MSKLAQLQQKRAAKIKEQQAMIDERNNTNERSFTEDQASNFDGLTTEIRSLEADIKREEEVVAAEKRSAAMNGIVIGGGDGEAKEKEKIQKRFSFKRALSTEMNRRAQDGAEAEIDAIAKKEFREAQMPVPEQGFSIPSGMMFRADSQTATQDSLEYGGATVKETAGEVVPNFVNRLGIQDLGVQIRTGLTGKYPLHTSGDYAFQNVEETETLTRQKTKYTKRILDAKRTGLVVGIANQLLYQSDQNIELDVRNNISIALNNRLLEDLINGPGTGADPLGLLNDAVFESSTAEGVATLLKILELEGAVDDADSPYGANKFLIHKKLASLLKGIKIDEGSGQFLMDRQNKLYGTDTYKTSKMPVLSGTNDTYPIIYGDFSSVVAGFWGGLNVMVDPYSSAKSGERELIVNVYRDIVASNPKAFAVNKKITLS